MDINIPTILEIIGFLTTLGTALVAYIKAEADVKKHQALFITFIGLIFTMLVSLRFDILPRISREATMQLQSLQTVAPEIKDIVDQTAGAIKGKTLSKNEAVFLKQLQYTLHVYDMKLQNFAKGKFVVESSEMPIFSNDLINEAKNEFLATSTNPAWWSETWGQNYYEINKNKVRSHVKIKRVFIVKDSDADKFRDIFEQQANDCIDVYTLTSRDAEDLQVYDDIVIVDENMSGSLSLKGKGDSIFSTNSEDIKKAKDIFSSLLARAKHIEPNASCSLSGQNAN